MDAFSHATMHTVEVTDCNTPGQAVPYRNTACRHISLWVREDDEGGNDLAERPRADRSAPFRHFSITTTAPAAWRTIIARSPTRRTNEKSLRTTAVALAGKEMDDDEGDAQRREIEFVGRSAPTR